MQSGETTCGRRAFLASGLAAGGALTAAGAAGARPRGAKDISLRAGALPARAFGKTGHTLPIFGHGGSTLMAGEAEQYYGVTAPALDERIAMVRYGYDRGIRYFDTARIYQESESIVGAALKGVRDDVFIATKVMVASADKVRESVEKSLAELQTDYADSVQIHGPMIERLPFETLMAQHAELAKMRDEGLLRFIGLTGHSRFENMHRLIATGGFDTLLIEHGYFKKGYNTRHSSVQTEWRELCLAKAHELGMGIVAMKVLGANIFGHNAAKLVPGFDAARRAELPPAAIRYVLRDPRVQVLNLGICFREDIDKNIAILTGDTAFTDRDNLLLAEFAAQAYETEYVKGLELV